MGFLGSERSSGPAHGIGGKEREAPATQRPGAGWVIVESGPEAGARMHRPVRPQVQEGEHDRGAVLTLLSSLDEREQLADRLLLPAK